MNQPIDDIRYSELLFLQSFPTSAFAREFSAGNPAEYESVRLTQILYVDLVMTLLEELFIRFEDDRAQTVVSDLRHEIIHDSRISVGESNPRYALQQLIYRSNPRLRITYRGLRRIEELRDVLRHERTLEDFGVLLSARYLNTELNQALRRPIEQTVSVICADMDGFKAINDQFGHAAGDIVMKAYLESVRDAVGRFGEAYRGVGDETTAIVVGLDHQRATQIAQDIRKRVGHLVCEYKGTSLPSVSASVGVASTPPEPRSIDVLHIAEQRQRLAKERGKNQVVSDNQGRA